MKFDVLAPNINKSNAEFSVERGNIRYALGAIKGVSASAMQGIVSEREKNGHFKSISDFCHRIDIKFINRKQLEQLIKAGAFDDLDSNRKKLFENIDNILKHISASTETKTSAQTSLFGTEELSSEIKLRDCPDWVNLERLRMEAEAIGFYLSAHPLDAYKESIEKLGLKNCNQLMSGIELGDSIKARIAACVESFQKRIAKTSGNKYAFVGLSDVSGTVEALIFADSLAKYENILTSGQPVMVNLSVDKPDPEKDPRVMINDVKTLDEAIAEQANGVIIYLNTISAVKDIKKILSTDKKGTNKVYFVPEIKDWDIKMELDGGYAFYDASVISKLRAIPGVTQIKEI